MPEKISILKESGETLTSNVVSVFIIPETGKRYIITTENAVDPHGLTVLHVSEIVDGILQRVATDDEWSSIKTIMRAIISGNVGSYQYLPTIENIKAGGQYSRDISVSASASKQMIDNYAAADKSAQANVSAPAENTNVVSPAINNSSDAGAMAQMPVPPSAQPIAEPPVQQPIKPSTIFPESNAPVNTDDELVPGIAELPGGGVLQDGAMDINPVVPQEVANPTSTLQQTPSIPLPGAPTDVQAPIAGVEQPVIQNILPDANMAQDAQMQVPPQPSVNGLPVGPSMENVNVAPVGVVPQGTQISPVAQAPLMNSDMTAIMPVAPEISQSAPISSTQMLGVQVAEPTQVVPTAQIAQDVQVPPMEINTQVNPSFAPSATLDEVVAAAQEMFMEGVKNLVQTIQEKVYRDLYAKEAELKAREEALIQKENQLNGGQVPAVVAQPMPTPSVVPQTQIPPQPVIQQQPVMQQQPMMNQQVPPVGPMIVSADNDK